MPYKTDIEVYGSIAEVPQPSGRTMAANHGEFYYQRKFYGNAPNSMPSGLPYCYIKLETDSIYISTDYPSEISASVSFCLGYSQTKPLKEGERVHMILMWWKRQWIARSWRRLTDEEYEAEIATTEEPEDNLPSAEFSNEEVSTTDLEETMHLEELDYSQVLWLLENSNLKTIQALVMNNPDLVVIINPEIIKITDLQGDTIICLKDKKYCVYGSLDDVLNIIRAIDAERLDKVILMDSSPLVPQIQKDSLTPFR